MRSNETGGIVLSVLAAFILLYIVHAWIGIIPDWIRIPAFFLLVASLFWRRWPSLVLSAAVYTATLVLMIRSPETMEYPPSAFDYVFYGILILFTVPHWSTVIFAEGRRYNFRWADPSYEKDRPYISRRSMRVESPKMQKFKGILRTVFFVLFVLVFAAFLVVGLIELVKRLIPWLLLFLSFIMSISS